MTYRKVKTSERYPTEIGSYYIQTERGQKSILEWFGEITIGWRNTDYWLEQI